MAEDARFPACTRSRAQAAQRREWGLGFARIGRSRKAQSTKMSRGIQATEEYLKQDGLVPVGVPLGHARQRKKRNRRPPGDGFGRWQHIRCVCDCILRRSWPQVKNLLTQGAGQNLVQSSWERCDVASSSIQSSSSHDIPLRPGTFRVGPGRYREQDLGP